MGVGASAGGLDALKELVSAIPPNSGMAYIFVQHLAPNHESMLTEILQKSTEIPVVEIVDQVKVEPNFIYVIPANKMLLAKGDKLVLMPRTEGERQNTIDVFLTSLAELHQDQAIGVILSGTGSDGTVGLKTIKDMRGITIVQDDSAAYSGMPHSALEADVVDFVLKPSEIPGKIQELLKDVHIQLPDDSISSIDEEYFQQILLVIKSKKGVDFKYYKQSTIRRRILRRKSITKSESLKEYLQLLLESKAEQDALFKDILIPVTCFFRDVKIFEILCESILPSILSAKPEHLPIRIWVAGCSTGEEAYSLAICISEYFAANRNYRPVQIFASDISEQVIAKARSGIYEKRDVAGISEERLKTYFTKSDGVYHLNKSIREMCVFAVQNFLTDPPFARMDIISCRNVLIYMDEYLQKKALTTFHYSLTNNGWLILGKSESTSQVSDLFQQAYPPEKIYTRKAVPSKFMHVTSLPGEIALKKKDQQLKDFAVKKDDFQLAADHILLDLYSPACVVINEYMDIVQFRGATSSFLELPQGRPTLNVLKMAKEGLAFQLRNAIHKAKSGKEIVRKDGIILSPGNRKVSIEVIPLTKTIEVYYAVVFKETTDKTSDEASVNTGATPADSFNDSDLSRITQLEKELAQSREDMRSITEEQEAVNEELQSANEELLSGSEELQSLNEELETSKEEVQSSNEELSMLNQELIERNEQLVHSRKYAEAIITTIHEPLIVLNKEFRIRSANASFYELCKTSPKETEGKLFFEFENCKWDLSGLKSKLESVLATKELLNVELNIQLGKGVRTLALNVRPISNTNIDEPLILLALQDITERRMIEKKLADESLMIAGQRQLLLDSFRDAPALLALFKGPDYICELANVTFISRLGLRDPVGGRIDELIVASDPDNFLSSLRNVYTTGETYIENEMPVKRPFANGDHIIYLNLVVQAMKHSDDQIDGLFLFAIDVTEQVTARKATEANLQKVLNSLDLISWTALPNGTITFFNKQFYQYTGLTEEIAINKGWPAFVDPSQAEDISIAWNEAIRLEKDFHQELLMMDKQKVPRWFVVKSTSVQDDKGSVVLWIVSCTDIHEQKLFTVELGRKVDERTKELMQVNTDLERSNSDLQQFASVASHDLQEPLRKIITFVALLNRRYVDAMPKEAVEYLGKITQSSERMSQLIHELLEYSRIMHSNKKYSPVDMDGIIKNVLTDVDLLVADTGAVIKYEKPFPSIEANALQMNHLFYNLLTNSLKFFRRGNTPEVSIDFRYPTPGEIDSYGLPRDNKYIDFMIADKGIGFEQMYEKQIFQIFERLHPMNQYAGTGIGLALCKKIAENHQGHIFATSKVNEGATFHVVLPVHQ